MARLVRGGVAAEQAGVGDVLDLPQCGTERSGVVTGLVDGGADRGDAAIYERSGSISQIVFSLPFFRVLARKSERVRRFFGLQ